MTNRGFNRGSLLLLVGLLVLYTAVGIGWRHLLDPSKGMDWLLLGIWAAMTGLVVWGIDPRADLRLAAVALCGGFVIEWWGTNTQLWRYFVDERPPLWILPAWPIAALSIERLTRLAEARLPDMRRLYWFVVPGFVLLMIRFLWPTIRVSASQVVIALMVLVTITGRRRDRDMALFVVGAAFGFLLEYWGTTRYCWIYYTAEHPPLVAVLAHGFASIAFARGVDAVLALRIAIGWDRSPTVPLSESVDGPSNPAQASH
ncbi:MAG: hypothetical protein AAFV53_29005 [Myxococcota bacterium]